MRLTQFMKPLSRFLQASSTPPPSVAVRPGTQDSPAPESIRQLPDGDALRQLAGLRSADVRQDADSNARAHVERLAQERLAQLIDARSIDFTELLATTGSTDTLLSVAGLCGDLTHLARAFDTIDDAQRIAQLVTDGPSSQVRQAAAQRIAEPTELRRLLKLLRGRVGLFRDLPRMGSDDFVTAFHGQFHTLTHRRAGLRLEGQPLRFELPQRGWIQRVVDAATMPLERGA